MYLRTWLSSFLYRIFLLHRCKSLRILIRHKIHRNIKYHPDYMHLKTWEYELGHRCIVYNTSERPIAFLLFRFAFISSQNVLMQKKIDFKIIHSKKYSIVSMILKIDIHNSEGNNRKTVRRNSYHDFPLKFSNTQSLCITNSNIFNNW